MSKAPWGLKDVLAPVISRIIIYGANQFDLESVFKQLEGVTLLHSKILEENWWKNWDQLGKNYSRRGKKAEAEGHNVMARDMFFYASACYYAASLINYMDFEHKRHIVGLYTSAFQSFARHAKPAIQRSEIKIDEKNSLPGYLYLPSGRGPFPCMIILTGVGTFKEESHVFAAPLVERGIAVFTPDIPGIGEALFFRDQKFKWAEIRRALSAVLDFLYEHAEINSSRIGIYGICMAGPMGLKFAAYDRRIKLCTALFPLQIEIIELARVPLWMQEGTWYDYFSGKTPPADFIADITVQETENIDCPLFFIHSRDDNWMPLAAVEKLAKKSNKENKVLAIDEQSVFKSEIQVIHTIPVGEQVHWVRHVMADWISDKFSEIRV